MQENEEKQTRELIGELLKRKDPALVGIRKILRSKSESLSASRSFTTHTPEVFGVETKDKSRENETIFNDEELEELEHGKKILELEETIKEKNVETELARQEAFESGKAAGIEEYQEKTKLIIAEIEEKMKSEVQKRLAEQISQELIDRQKYFKSLEEDFYRTITLIVKKILTAELQTNPDLIINTIKQSLAHISQRGRITIRVSSDDLDYVKEKLSSFNRHNDGAYEIDIIADEHLKAGGCLVETDSTIVDAQIEKRTENVMEMVEKIWNEAKIAPAPEQIEIEQVEIEQVEENPQEASNEETEQIEEEASDTEFHHTEYDEYTDSDELPQ